MSLTELQDRIAGLTADERLQIAAFLAELESENEAAFREEADRRMKAMDEGRKVTMEEFEALHRKRASRD